MERFSRNTFSFYSFLSDSDRKLLNIDGNISNFPHISLRFHRQVKNIAGLIWSQALVFERLTLVRRSRGIAGVDIVVPRVVHTDTYIVHHQDQTFTSILRVKREVLEVLIVSSVVCGRTHWQ